MTTYLCPILQDSQFTDNGNFLASGLIWFYEAGSTTPLAAYTSQTGASAWTNPIVLDVRGETGGTIWLAAGQAYKIVLEGPPEYGQAHGVVISTFDNIQGVNDPATPTGGTAQNWFTFAGSPVYVSGTQFTLSGDQTSTFQVNRRIRTQNSSGVVYGTITASAYTTLTTITVANDSGALDNGLNSVDYGLIEIGTRPSIPLNQRLFTTSSPTFASATIPTVTGNLVGNVTGNSGTTSQTNFTDLTLNSTQVWADINNTISKATNGYANFANGLSIRWGTVILNGATTITFPLTFNAACVAVVIVPNIISTIITTGSYTPTTFIGTNTSGASIAASYIAIGY